MKSAQITRETRELLRVRAGGLCERAHCGNANGLEAHHRDPRGMGGTRRGEVINGLANLVLICHACHRSIESDREQAVADGWLIRDDVLPADQPVRGFRTFNYLGPITALLANDGGIAVVWDDTNQLPA